MVIGVNRRGVSVASDVKDQTGDEQRRCAQHYPQPVKLAADPSRDPARVDRRICLVR